MTARSGPLCGAAAMRPELVLTSHGEPVLTNGAAALDEALAVPAWGE
jgi:hypothetical protein